MDIKRRRAIYETYFKMFDKCYNMCVCVHVYVRVRVCGWMRLEVYVLASYFNMMQTNTNIPMAPNVAF